jgi:hypothetical protein
VPERNDAVIQRVRELLEKYPTLKSKQLLDMAVRMDPALHELSPRSFHARYVLPIRRERARAEGRTRPHADAGRKQASKRGSGKRAAQNRQDGASPNEIAAASPRRKRSAPGDGEHARVREILLRFTRDVAGAETRSDLVDLVGGIDSVVREILAGR